MSDFIWVKDDVLTSEFCKHCIEKFEHDQSMLPGVVGGGLNKNIKDTMDVMITTNGNWPEEDEVFSKSLTECLHEYEEYLYGIAPSLEVGEHDYYDTGYQIQRTKPESVGYTWHHDFTLTREDTGAVAIRVLTYIWYLNTIDYGGYTEFANGESIKPEAGKLILFPADWSHVHRGIPPTYEDKYICTGWIYSRF